MYNDSINCIMGEMEDYFACKTIGELQALRNNENACLGGLIDDYMPKTTKGLLMLALEDERLAITESDEGGSPAEQIRCNAEDYLLRELPGIIDDIIDWRETTKGR